MNSIKQLSLSFLIIILLSLATQGSQAQSVGINYNAAAPNSTAALDIDVSALGGVKKGLLIPRILLADRTAMNPLAAPAQGLVVYQTDGVQGFYYNTSNTTTPTWVYLANSGSGGIRWDQLQNPTGNLLLAHGANTTTFTFDGATADAFNISSNSLVAGSLFNLSSTSIAGSGSSNTTILNVYSTGTNTNPSHGTTGINSGVYNVGTDINYGGNFYSTGGFINYGIHSQTTTTNNGGTGYSVSGLALGADNSNFGGFFVADSATQYNEAVHAQTGTNNGVAVNGYNSSTGNGVQIGVWGRKIGNTSFATSYGVAGSATGTGGFNYGGEFYASGATNNRGVNAHTDADNGYGVYGTNSSTGGSFQYGIYGSKTGNTATGIGYGVYGNATGTGNSNYGGSFTASGATHNYAVNAFIGIDSGYGVYSLNLSSSAGSQYGVYSSKTGNTGTGTGYGIYSTSTGTGNNNYGGFFTASGATNNQAVHAETAADGGYGVYGNNSSGGSGFQFGIYGTKTGTGTGSGFGVYGNATGGGVTNQGGGFAATGATNNYGISSSATGTGSNNLGGDFFASGGTNQSIAVRGKTDANGGYGVYGWNSATGSAMQYGVYGFTNGTNPNATAYAVTGNANGSSFNSYGGYFQAFGASNINRGVFSTAIGSGGTNYGGDFSSQSGANFNYGIQASVGGSTGIGYAVYGVSNITGTKNYGGYFSATGQGGAVNYAAWFDQGNVGIGTGTPLTKLHVKGTVNVFDGGTSTHTGNFWQGTSSIDGVEIVTSAGGDAYIGVQRAAGAGINVSRPSGAGTLVSFEVNGAGVGSISTNGTNTSFNTTSDMRLKENIIPTRFGLDVIMKVNVKDYNFKTDANKELQTGFIAQELYKLYPQAVHVGGADAKTNPWTIDYSKLTPLLVKAVQDQQKEIAEDQTQIRDEIKQIEDQQRKFEQYKKETDKKINDLIEMIKTQQTHTSSEQSNINTLPIR